MSITLASRSPFYSLTLATTVFAMGGATIYFVGKACFQSQRAFSNKAFWGAVAKVPAITFEYDPVLLSAALRDRALMCVSVSQYVNTYLIESDFNGSVLDLGCGPGANSYPLLKKGCKVTIVDKEEAAIASFKAKELTFALTNLLISQPLTGAIHIHGDMTEVAYPGNMDAIICVDTLQYIPSAKIKATMAKIYDALNPGGFFIGTIFFMQNKREPLIDVIEKVGAHFYPDKLFAREIITRSGFQIIRAFDRGCSSFEFLATKLT